MPDHTSGAGLPRVNDGSLLFLHVSSKREPVRPEEHEHGSRIHFHRYTPPRPPAEIDAELKEAEAELLRLLSEVTA